MIVFHTPGHSKGSISLFLQREGVLFSGDAVPVTGDLPVYDDAAASVHSVKIIRALNDIRFLLSLWDEPQRGDAAFLQIDRALEYLQKIHEVIVDFAVEGSPDPFEITKKAAAILGLPPQAVTPLLARTFAANLLLKDKKNLVSDS
jgi:hypothetical protein